MEAIEPLLKKPPNPEIPRQETIDPETGTSVCELLVKIQLKLKLKQHPPFCRVWLVDQWSEIVTKKTKLEETERSCSGDEHVLVLEDGRHPVARGCKYLVIDFHKQQEHVEDEKYVNKFEPELGQLRVNLYDVLKASVDDADQGSKFEVSFRRDAVPITGTVEVTAEFSQSKASNNWGMVLGMMETDNHMEKYYEARDKRELRKDWLQELSKNWFISKFSIIMPDIPVFFARSQQIGEDALEGVLHESWMRGHSINFVAGPALVHAMQGLVGVILAYIFFPLIYGYSLLPSCGKLGANQIAAVPVSFYGLFAFFAVWKLSQELLMMSAVLPLRVMLAGRPKYPNPLELLACLRRCQGSFGEGAAEGEEVPDGDRETSGERFPNPLRFLGNANCYVISKMVGSLLASFEICSASLFLARILATRVMSQTDAAPHWDMESVWMDTLVDSKWKWLFDRFWYPTFLQLAVGSWLVFFAQVFYSLGYSVPMSEEIQDSSRPPQPVVYDFREAKDVHFDTQAQIVKQEKRKLDGEDYEPMIRHQRDSNAKGDVRCRGAWKWAAWAGRVCRPKSKTKRVQHEQVGPWVAVADYAIYSTPFCNKQTHGHALAAIAKTGRMSLALTMDPEYTKAAIEHWSPSEVLRVQRQQNQAFVFFMFQKLFSVSMQATLNGISKNLSKANGGDGRPDTMAMVTVIIGCCLGAVTVISEVISIQTMKERVLVGVEQKLKNKGTTKLQAHHQKTIRGMARWESRVSCTAAVIFLAVLAWCFIKVIMSDYCDCGMWNLCWGFFWPGSWGNLRDVGCVSFSNASSALVCTGTNQSFAQVASYDIANTATDITGHFLNIHGSMICYAV